MGENVLNLSNKVLTEAQINVLSEGVGFCPVPLEINKEQLKQDFTDLLTRKMRNKWHFRDEPSENFSETLAFRKKSTWQAPKDSQSPFFKVFLSQL